MIFKKVKIIILFIMVFSFNTFADNTISHVYLTSDMPYAENSKIHNDPAKLYKNTSSNSNGITVCINAGHGTKIGTTQKTLCHPDGSPKITGGSTSAGATTAVAVSSGMTFLDGTPESDVTLDEAIILKDVLLARGYNVLMIRESEDVLLDNIARTVIANKYADCHIAIHWDSSQSDKGAFYLKVPSDPNYKAMAPVSGIWQKSDKLGESLLIGLRKNNIKIWGNGYMEIDLTQTSYSSIPSIDIECGDKASSHSYSTLKNLANGLADGIDTYFLE